MSKTIEEVAREATRKEFCCESCVYKQYCDICGGQNTAFDCDECPADSWEDGFKAGAQHVLSLPLSERLTETEKAMIRVEYELTYLNDLTISSNGNLKIRFALERIFGKELFN